MVNTRTPDHRSVCGLLCGPTRPEEFQVGHRLALRIAVARLFRAATTMNDPSAREALNNTGRALIDDAKLSGDFAYDQMNVSLVCDPARGPAFRAGYRRAIRAAVTWVHRRASLPGQRHDVLNGFANDLGFQARCVKNSFKQMG